MEEEYLGFIEGYTATTDIDSHGDQLSPEAIEKMAEQIKSNPKLRIAPYNHDMNQPMGYITDVRVDTKGSWKGLHVTIGVYKSRPDLWEKVKSGEIKGLSYKAKILEMEYQKMNDIQCLFDIEVNSQEWNQIYDMLLKMGAKVEPVVSKAIDIPAVITVSISILTLPGAIYGIYNLWNKIRGKNKGQWIRITTKKRHYNFDDNTVDEIVKQIEFDVKK